MVLVSVKLDDFIGSSNTFTWRHLLYPHQIYRKVPFKGITASIDSSVQQNLINLTVNILDPLQLHYPDQFGINSCFRSLEENVSAKGSKTSDHLIGAAVDLDFKTALQKGLPGSPKNKDIYFYVKNAFTFKQLIWETETSKGHGTFAENGEPWWVHVSYVDGNNKMQVLS